jgi:hypothetical protein
VLQAQRYQNHIDVDAVTEKMRTAETEVGRLWREAQSTPSGAPETR